jgi:hypothetical protein
MLESGQSLTPEDSHCQWHLSYNPEATVSCFSISLDKKSAKSLTLCVHYSNAQPKNNKQPENNIEGEIRKLILNLCNNDPNTISNTIQQFKLIAAGTHMAVPIQAPDIKQQTKGQSTLSKKRGVTSTKRNPLAFEIVETDLKKDKLSRKRASKPTRMKTKQTKMEIDTSNQSDQSTNESNYADKDEDYNETNKLDAPNDKIDNADAQPNNFENKESGKNQKTIYCKHTFLRCQKRFTSITRGDFMAPVDGCHCPTLYPLVV